MRTVTATSASRGFSDLLDAVERGDLVTITRGGHAIAELRPVHRRTVGDLRARLADVPGLGPEFEADLESATALLTQDEGDAWADD
ncbi:MAG TPA: type II toxin-antitoxin system Phd/YefM family antitoxin [Candidatus Ruania gallistercoris]|uniref:Type II toxin-antitoxin system Phd/YefM family antitoxin n=1 Tax=Candidatus Ruania gallistercoris TaxID=2838746 RepID=A0A9D2EHE2_9MICO|nr:type II toxin-antitoxin system Phd/YefM family antitoxin [Candidatus Ruania gallistercoris]